MDEMKNNNNHLPFILFIIGILSIFLLCAKIESKEFEEIDSSHKEDSFFDVVKYYLH